MTDIRVSYCATNLNTRSTLTASLASIEALARLVEGSFEVVVADGPSDPEVRALLATWAAEQPHRILVRHDRRNRGYGRRVAFEASRGELIVPFDTSIAYASVYGTILALYERLATDRMLFSELCALRRSTIEAVGGWRDLVGGEDVDLYAPVMERFGLLAYPIGDPTSQARVLGTFARQMRYAHGSRPRGLYRMFTVQRDQAIGANYRVADMMAFNTAKPLATRVAARLWFTGAVAAAALSPIPRRRVGGTNNYLFVRERTIESMLRGDYSDLGWPEGPPPRLPLTKDEVGYLMLRSQLGRDAFRQHPELFPEKR